MLDATPNVDDQPEDTVAACPPQQQLQDPWADGRESLPNSMPHRQEFQYAACYCEENVFLLCRQLVAALLAAPHEMHAVFISNPQRQVCSTPIMLLPPRHRISN